METAANQTFDEMVDFREIFREIKTVKEILKSATIEIEKYKRPERQPTNCFDKNGHKHTDKLTEMKIDFEKLKSIWQHQDVVPKN